jgi:cyanate lyase
VHGTRELRGENDLLQDEANKSFRFTLLQNQLGLSNIFLSLNLMNHARLSVSAREAKHMQRSVTRQVWR